ncbi:MAG: aspartate-semialdehyde dehydrogenase [bacterium]|nr:aspartate-semialdehyde dehydrogenase [bacterium]
MKDLVIAVVGVTGAVGGTMLAVLESSRLPIARVVALATARSAGSSVQFRGENLTVQNIADFDFAGVDLALFAGGEIASADYVPRARSAGAIVIDNSAAYRMCADVPLVVPEVNPEHLRYHRGIIANPNCSTIQMVVALAPVQRKWGLQRVTVATYQSVSGTGKEAIAELRAQANAWSQGAEIPAPKAYPQQIAFNLLPQIGSFDAEGFSGEEIKMIKETQKILDAPQLPVMATCVRVPVFYAHSEAVQFQTEREAEPGEIRAELSRAPGIKVLDEPQSGIYPTPLQAEHQDLVLVGRIRRDASIEKGLAMWVVGDNLRKGAATNAVQIAEKMAEMQLLG